MNPKLIIISEKNNFRQLMKINRDVVVIPWEFSRFNLFRTPLLVQLISWLNVQPFFFNRLDILFSSISYIIEHANTLYQEFKYTGNPNQLCPHLSDVYEAVKNSYAPKYSKTANYKETSSSRLNHLLMYSGKMFTSSFGLNMEKLFTKHLVIEVNGLFSFVRYIVVTYFLAYYYYRQQTIGRTPYIHHLYIIDEGQQLFRRQDELREIPSFIDKFFAEKREYGFGALIGTQQIRDLPNSLVGNTPLKIATGYSDKRDLTENCRVLGITDSNQIQYLGETLKAGTALASIPSYPNPFIIHPPYVGLDDNVTDEEVLLQLLEKANDLYHPTEVEEVKQDIRIKLGIKANATGFIATTKETNIKAEPSQPIKKQKSSPPKQPDKELTLTIAVLRDQLLSNHPFDPLSKLFQKHNLTGGKFTRKKNNLEKQGIYKIHSLQKKKNKILFGEPTDKAIKLAGIPMKSFPGKGDFLHKASVWHIKLWGEDSGYKAHIEYFLSNNHPVDLALENNGNWILVEVGISEPVSKEIENLKKIVQSSLVPEKIIMAVRDSKYKKKLVELISAEISFEPFKDIIEIKLAGDFVEIK